MNILRIGSKHAASGNFMATQKEDLMICLHKSMICLKSLVSMYAQNLMQSFGRISGPTKSMNSHTEVTWIVGPCTLV